MLPLRDFWLTHLAKRSIAAAACLLLWSPGVCSSGAEPARLTILHTTDLHGHVFAHRGRDGEMRGGLDRISTLVKRQREMDPEALLLDCGDTIQGNSMAFLVKGRHIIDCMNHMGYDAMVIGNHEFNFGQDTLALRKWESRFPWLSANIRQGSPQAEPWAPALPYILKEVRGIKVCILGLTVTDIPTWEQPEYIERLRFEDIVKSARSWSQKLRPMCDVLVALAHTGVEPSGRWAGPGDYDPGAAGTAVAKACPEIDLIICGHRHVEVTQKNINGVVLTEAGSWGSHLGVVDIDLEEGKVVNINARLIEVTPDIPRDPEVVKLMEPYREQWAQWGQQEVGVVAEALDFRGSQHEETAAVDLIHDAMMEATGADVTFHVAFNASTVIPAGPVTNQQIFDIYEYDNALWVLTLTGRQVKEALEAGAALYKSWGFLTAGGLRYTLDVTRPKGERLVRVEHMGKPLADDAVLEVAVNHYNAVGGGGLEVLRGAKAVRKTGMWVRDAISDYVRKHSPVVPVKHGWWTVADQENVSARREMVPLQHSF